MVVLSSYYGAINLYHNTSMDMLNNEDMKHKMEMHKIFFGRIENQFLFRSRCSTSSFFTLVYLDYTRNNYRQPDLNALSLHVSDGALAITCPSHVDMPRSSNNRHMKKEGENLVKACAIDADFGNF